MMNKTRMLVYLERHLRDLESKAAPPDFVQMAKAGMSYTERQRIADERSKFAADHTDEITAFAEAVNFIRLSV
jgi:hypothetical protein